MRVHGVAARLDGIGRGHVAHGRADGRGNGIAPNAVADPAQHAHVVVKAGPKQGAYTEQASERGILAQISFTLKRITININCYDIELVLQGTTSNRLTLGVATEQVHKKHLGRVVAHALAELQPARDVVAHVNRRQAVHGKRRARHLALLLLVGHGAVQDAHFPAVAGIGGKGERIRMSEGGLEEKKGGKKRHNT